MQFLSILMQFLSILMQFLSIYWIPRSPVLLDGRERV